jgi:hypothetical protein
MRTGVAIVAGLLLCNAAFAAAPVLTDLQPRGAQKGKTLTLTLAGRNLTEGARIITNLPAAITPLTASRKGGLPFLLELKPDIPIGTYPIRVQTSDGISNILLFTVGDFPEIDEEETTAHTNGTIATAQVVKSTPVTINGTLAGADRDDFRISARAGERLVFEVEARRCGSAIDPVLTLLDQSGKQLARNEDAPGIGVDSRIDYTFAHDGDYVIEVNDARFSKQEQNFYRLKIGSYIYPESVFPLGGKHGETVQLEFEAKGTPVRASVKLPQDGDFTMVAMPGSPALPFRFALGNYPELRGPVDGPLPLPVTVNGRIAKPAQVDRYTVRVTPGESLLFELQSRELGTSALDALITISDSKGKKLASAGDIPPAADVFSLQTGNRTSNDPFLNFKVPEGVNEITVSVEDIARRGGPNFGYRLTARKQAEDYLLSASPAYINVPRGGTVQVVVNADRRGYDGPIQALIPNLPKGWTAEGGYIATETIDSSGQRSISRRGVMTVTAAMDAESPPSDLAVAGEARLADGSVLRRRASGMGAVVDIAGGTGLPDAASSDRQKSFTAPWLGMTMPAALSPEPVATIEIRSIGRTPMEQGDAYNFEWKIVATDGNAKSLSMPATVNVDAPGVRDIRIINVRPAAKGAATGTFTVTTTKATTPAKYDLVVSANLMVDGQRETIMSRAIPFEVVEGGTSDSETSAGSH